MPKHRNRRTFQERTGFPLKLLEPGYSGELEPPELEVLKTELTKNSKLRKRWGFEDNETITLKKIKYIAENGVEEDGQN
tara:strand:- start:153 stop:389 length:237 start_codon:yes stop_codon:yes gene_type:complete